MYVLNDQKIIQDGEVKQILIQLLKCQDLLLNFLFLCFKTWWNLQ